LRIFNTEGPVFAKDHYCIPPLERVDIEQILTLIDWKKYFVLHAPRQSGKTSILKALAELLNDEGTYRCVYMNVEPAQAAREDVDKAIPWVVGELAIRVREALQDDAVDEIWSQVSDRVGSGLLLKEVLVRWSKASPKPLVLLIDEIDTMVGDSLISVLRQLRSGYDMRPESFPQSVILCGVRDVRDYRIFSATDQSYTSGGSAFNIKAESVRIGDFCEPEVQALLAQHTADAGQGFEVAAVERIWALTRGQPWLVNALAQQMCFKDKAGRDRSAAIGADAVEVAKEVLIVNRVTHLDQLAAKLKEDRVRRVIEPMLAGRETQSYSSEDLDYVRDLGLVAADDPVRMANPIYAEVVPRQLSYALQSGLQQVTAWYVDAAGELNVHSLLEGFQGFYRENAEHAVQRFDYGGEAGLQLLLQAWLQKVVNSGGRIEREYGLGRGRTDLLILWPQGGSADPRRVAKHVIECKVWRPGRSLDATMRIGLQQTAGYMDRCGADSGHLVVFDRRPDKTWAERIFCRDERSGDRLITVWGM